MRRLLFFVLVTIFLGLIFLLNTLSTLISLLFEDTPPDAIHLADVSATKPLSFFKSSTFLIPKIIHQTYKNESIPELWQPAQKSCRDLHSEYQYIMWTDEAARTFIANEYPWFVSTFDGYAYNIQRADALRYFVLVHYGGTYIDLDQGCRRRIDPLLAYPAFVRQTKPTGISNDIMGSTARHPFFLRVINSLQEADKDYLSPYITIMATTGPLFLSVMLKRWNSENSNQNQKMWAGRVRVVVADLAASQEWSFFESYMGSSWHGRDAKLMLWMGKGHNWLIVSAVSIVFCVALVTVIWRGCTLVLGAGMKTKLIFRKRSIGDPLLDSLKPNRSLPFWRCLTGADRNSKSWKDNL